MLMNVLVLTEPPARRSTLYFIQEEAASVGMFCKATPNSGRMTTSGSLTTLKLKSERSLRTALGIPTARVGLYISANTQSRAAPQKLFSPGISQTLGQGLREGETQGLMSGSGGNLCSNWRADEADGEWILPAPSPPGSDIHPVTRSGCLELETMAENQGLCHHIMFQCLLHDSPRTTK